MFCFHVVLSQLVPPKPQTRVFPHGLENTSDTPVLEWLRKTFLPPSMCGSAVNTGINALQTVWILFTFMILIVMVTLAVTSIIMGAILKSQ